VSLKHGWQHERDDAKRSDLRIHDLRHSAAWLLINGEDLFAVGKFLGHAGHNALRPPRQ
jgi:integrase